VDYETLLFDMKDGVATVCLNRPERMNAWNAAMARDLTQALTRCDEDDEIRSVVLTGTGRAFCAGADLGGGEKTFSSDARGERRRDIPPVYPNTIRKPVIAALNGHAIGVGITYPMLCDIRFVAEDAKISFAFVRRGVIPELGSHVTAARAAGLSNAASLLLTGRIIDGREFARMGLALEALPAEKVLPRAQEFAREFTLAAPASVAISKRLLWEGLGTTVEGMMQREGPLFAWVGNQPDAREGVKSFLERRAPEWKLQPSKDLPPEL
jgi:enoyl-CoA hydratase/carnithine racemase